MPPCFTLCAAAAPHISALMAAVGSSVGATRNEAGQCGCFDALCSNRGFAKRNHGSGHDCYNVLATAIGANRLGFMWPQVEESVGAPNAHYELPQCDHIDQSASYRPRACARAAKVKMLLGNSVKTKLKPAKPSPAASFGKGWFKRRRLQKGGNGVGGGVGGGRVSVAVCVTGQLRSMISRGLHTSLKAHLVDVLHADAFLHVDTSDTRQWGTTRDARADEFHQLVAHLSPVDANLVSYVPPPTDHSSCAAAAATGIPSARVCEARDCGSFSCGCYVPGCTHCVATQYMPQHRHAAGCLQMIMSHEARRGAPYDLVIRIRPDLNVTRPFPSTDAVARRLQLSTSATSAAPVLCTQGGGSPIEGPAPLASLPLTLDDKFAVMPRQLARVYLNASGAFHACQTRRDNERDCTTMFGGKGGVKGSVKGGKLKGSWAVNSYVKGRALSNMVHGRGRSEKRRALSDGRSMMRRGVPAPYWATPQCILKRHLLQNSPGVRMVDCTRDPGEPALLRLIRPRGAETG